VRHQRKTKGNPPSTSPVDSASTKKGSSKSGDDRSDDDVESDSDASAESDIQIIPGPEGKEKSKAKGTVKPSKVAVVDLERKSKSSYQCPEDMDGNSISAAFNFSHKTNAPWTCPLCSSSGKGVSRIHGHAETQICYAKVRG